MKLITQEEYDNFPIVDGFRICSSGDYRNINKFAKGCFFAERCSFEGLKFSETEKVYFIRINNIGSRRDGLMIFNAIDGLYIRCGCWFGNARDFLNEVKKNHGNNIHSKTYHLAVKMAEVQFGGE